MININVKRSFVPDAQGNTKQKKVFGTGDIVLLVIKKFGGLIIQ